MAQAERLFSNGLDYSITRLLREAIARLREAVGASGRVVEERRLL
jgi:hypothetical protein